MQEIFYIYSAESTLPPGVRSLAGPSFSSRQNSVGSWSLQSKPLQALSSNPDLTVSTSPDFIPHFPNLYLFLSPRLNLLFLDKMFTFFCEQTACRKINTNFVCSKLDDETEYIFKNNFDKKSSKLLSLILYDPPPLSSEYAS